MSSSVNAPAFAALQHWLQLVVLGRERFAAPPGTELTEVIAAPSEALARKRLTIYSRGYLRRLIEALQAEYPLLRRFVGNRVFELFAAGYLAETPPRSWSLYHLGQGLPRFLARTQPHAESVTSSARAALDVPADIAAVERAKADAEVEAGTEDPDAPMVADAFSPWLCVQTPPCLRLVPTQRPLYGLLRALERGAEYQIPSASPGWLAVSRVDYRVRLTTLDRWQFLLLSNCCKPQRLADVARLTAAQWGRSPNAVLSRLLIWLPAAFSAGYLTCLDSDRAASHAG